MYAGVVTSYIKPSTISINSLLPGYSRVVLKQYTEYCVIEKFHNSRDQNFRLLLSGQIPRWKTIPRSSPFFCVTLQPSPGCELAVGFPTSRVGIDRILQCWIAIPCDRTAPHAWHCHLPMTPWPHDPMAGGSVPFIWAPSSRRAWSERWSRATPAAWRVVVDFSGFKGKVHGKIMGHVWKSVKNMGRSWDMYEHLWKTWQNHGE